MEEPLFVYVKIPEMLGPVDREDKYEDPLGEALTSAGLGEVTGGGTMLSSPNADGKREVKYCGIDVDLFDLERGLEFLKSELRGLGAPQGTALEFTLDGVSRSVDIYE